MSTVTSANRYFISRLDSGTFQNNVKFSNFTCYILILEGNSFIVGQGISVPVFDDTLLNIINELMFLFHFVFAHLV